VGVIYDKIRNAHLADFKPGVRAPSAVVRAYAGVFHVPRWLVAGLVLATALALGAAAVRRIALPHAAEIALLLGVALASLLGIAATTEFALRYLVPVYPLLVAAGLATLAGLHGYRSRGAVERNAS
jgi:hypothetical protein